MTEREYRRALNERDALIASLRWIEAHALEATPEQIGHMAHAALAAPLINEILDTLHAQRKPSAEAVTP